MYNGILVEYPLEGREEIAKSLGVEPIIVDVLHNRGVRTEDDMREFIDGKISWDRCPLYDWDEKSGEIAEPILKRIQEAIDGGEKILIYGDADVDGITSASVLLETLQLLEANDPEFFIPTKEQGFGLQYTEVVTDFVSRGGTLVIMVDCGSSDASRISRMPVEILVLDHHELSKKKEKIADRMINPQMFGHSVLAGVGVVWTVCWALLERMGVGDTDRENFLTRELDLVALGTVADKCSLTEENHLLVKIGLRVLNAMDRVGIRCLFDSMGYDWEKYGMTADDIGWKFGPRINAVCRASGSNKKTNKMVEMLVTQSRLVAKRASRVAEEVYKLTKSDAGEKAEYFIEDPTAPIVHAVIDERFLNIAGVLASQISDTYNCPALVVAKLSNGSYGGSGRRPETMGEFDLRDFIGSQVPGGWAEGHKAAFGFGIPGDQWETFLEKACHEMETLRAENPDAFKPLPFIADAEVKLLSHSVELVKDMAKLVPFGIGNPKPVFYTPDVRIGSVRQVSRNFWIADVHDASGDRAPAKGFGECPYEEGARFSGCVYSLAKSKEYGVSLEILTVVL